jgi:hypothetical protein
MPGSLSVWRCWPEGPLSEKLKSEGTRRIRLTRAPIR